MRHRTNKNKSAFLCRRLDRLILLLLLLLLFESSRAPRRSDAREAVVVVVVVSRRRRRRRPARGGKCRKRALSAFSCENSTPLFLSFLWGKTCLFFERLDSYFLWYHGRARDDDDEEEEEDASRRGRTTSRTTSTSFEACDRRRVRAPPSKR